MKDGSPQLTKALALYQSLHQAPKFKSTSSYPDSLVSTLDTSDSSAAGKLLWFSQLYP